jgi:hypothetical protein
MFGGTAWVILIRALRSGFILHSAYHGREFSWKSIHVTVANWNWISACNLNITLRKAVAAIFQQQAFKKKIDLCAKAIKLLLHFYGTFIVRILFDRPGAKSKHFKGRFTAGPL